MENPATAAKKSLQIRITPVVSAFAMLQLHSLGRRPCWHPCCERICSVDQFAPTDLNIRRKDMAAKNKFKKDKNALITQQPALPMFGPTPFNMMRRFMDDMDRLFTDFGSFRPTPFLTTEFPFPKFAELEKTMWSPEIEVLENKGEMTIKADLPGLKLEDINVEISDGALAISGERKQETEEKKEGFYRSERTYGSFFRRIPLPEGVKPENANAKFENGVLEVKLALPVGATNGQKIEIKGVEEEKPKAVPAAA
jgi:HSP20 family protein